MLVGEQKSGRAWESCTRCVPTGRSPALYKAKVPYLSGIRKINHADPKLGYAFPVLSPYLVYPQVEVDALSKSSASLLGIAPVR
jgi:hypothetical protein